MATVLTEEEKRKKAIGFAFPQNPPPGGSIYKSREPSTPNGLGAVSDPPLDAQAASDRQAISGAWGQVKDVNQKLGAAIADIGTMPIRAAAGAYDTAVIRPMRAAGLNAAFMSQMVNPGSNADGSSMTPFMDQIRVKEGQTNAAAPAQPTPAKPVFMGSSVGTASQNQRMEGGPIATPSAPGTAQNPIIAKPGESVQQAAQTGGGAITKSVGANGVTEYSGMNVGLNPEFLNANGQAFKPRGSVVTAPSISGVVTPASGGYAFANAPSEADKAKAAAMGGRLDQYGNVITAQVDKALTKPDGTRWNANDMAALAASQQQPDSRMAMMGSGTNTGGFGLLDANYQRERALRMDASDSRNPGESKRAYEARIAGAAGALNAFRGEQTAAPRLAAAQKSTDAKTQADMALASRKMAFDEAQGGARMGLDVLRQTDEAKTNAMRRDATGMEIEKAKEMSLARQELIAAGDDQAKQKTAMQKLKALGVLDKNDSLKDNFLVVGGEQQYDQNGNRISDTPRVAIDLRTGQALNIGQGATASTPTSKSPPPLAEWIAAYKKANPNAGISDAEYTAQYETLYGARK